ncbi:MAG: DUF502 domain-containing protein [Planctomycetaceae bacterium]|nr:DUF502 domain-containing protein [Planctomycetaceae bacterium]
MNAFRQCGQRLLRYFLAGAFAVLPLVVTIAIVIWVAGFLQRFLGQDTPIGRIVRNLGWQFSPEDKTLAYIIGWAVVLGLVFLLGVAVEMGARRLIQSLTDAVLNRVPVVGGIYNTSKQLVSMLDRQDQADLKGMSVVYCIFGGSQGTAFLALLVSPQIYTIDGRDYQIVIVPTAPVPFGGGLLFVPTDCIRDANMSVDGLMSIYVSMGVTAPQFVRPSITAAEAE